HDRAEPGDHPGAEVITVGEPARQEDPGDAREIDVVVPERHGLCACDLERIDRVDVAVRTGEDDHPDPDAHAGTSDRVDDAAPIGSTRVASTTGVAESSQ